MIYDYLDSFIVGVDNEPMDLMDIASDETEKIKRYIRGESYTLTYADATYYAPFQSFQGLRAYLKEEYKDYHVSFFETYGSQGHTSRYTVEKYNGAIDIYASDSIPYDVYDSWFIIISSVPLNNLLQSPSLLDNETLVAFGVNFISNNYDGDGGGGGGGGIGITIPSINPSQYIKSITADNGNIDLLDVVGDESELISNLFTGNASIPIATNTYTLGKAIEGLVLELKEEYQNYKIASFRFFGVGQDIITGEETLEYTQDTFRNVPIPYEVMDEPLLYDSFLFIITSVDFEEFMENPDDEFIGAFGLTFQYDENEEDELPPEIINPTDLDATQYVRVLNGTTLAEYSVVPDVYNVKISQQINGLHTLNFNLLPYTNASNIYTPRIVEVDGDYFHVQQITKRHELQNLEMDIYCEHVSYELNYPPPVRYESNSVNVLATSNNDEYEWTQDTYEGTARDILEELLQHNDRFSIGLVEDNGYHLFTTKAEGFRTRINEFAEYIGLEVKWNKFTVALLKKRGHDNGLVFEVGKNIVSLTEVIDTVKLGKVKRSYELDVIDLNYVKDELENPLEAHSISLGDIVTIIDEQYRISRKDRVVGLTRDPFEKALPTIEFTNAMGSFTGNNKSGTGGAAIDLPIYQEEIERKPHSNAFGILVKASGGYSYAVGLGSHASGEISYAEGYNTQASGGISHAEGYMTIASGEYSHSEGMLNKSLGTSSHAEGYVTEASGDFSHSQGYNTRANGYYSHAEGHETISDGIASHSEGYETKATKFASHSEGAFTEATGDYSHSEGSMTYASGYGSHSEGGSTRASGQFSHSEGFYTEAKGRYAHVQGYYTEANVYASHVIGNYNKPLNGDIDTFDKTGDVFVIGNGIGGNRDSNALRTTFTGEMYIQGTYNTTGADYSEYFEWSDKNPDNEDRKGYVVTLVGDKIRIAKSDDYYILGIVSNNPSIIGNAYEDQWSGMYVTDEWGNLEYHYVDLPYDEPTKDGEITTVYRKSYVAKINPDYDPEQQYTPRSQRSEWDAVGMLGKLLVRDNGSCQINKYAKISETVDGTLTHSDTPTQFFVLRRVNDELIEVLIK